MANTVIRLKKSSVAAHLPISTQLEYGEIALNYADGKIFYKDPSNNIQQISGSANTFYTVNANGTLLVSTSPTDILTINPGNNIEIQGDFLTDTFTIAANLKYVYDVANAAFTSANNVAPQVAPSFNTANAAYATANLAYSLANVAFNLQNNDYNMSNAAFTVANSAYGFANGVATNTTSAFGHSNITYTAVNSAFGVINATFTQSNTDNGRLSSAYVSLNAGYTVANAAFDKANAALANTSGVYFNGDLFFPSGNVGIGITSGLTRKLQVQGDINSGVKMSIGNANNGSGAFSQYSVDAYGSTFYAYSFANTYTTSGRFIAGSGLIESTGVAGLGFAATTATGNISFWTGASPTEKMRITSQGNVGIGTINANYTLDVIGSANISQPTLLVAGQNVLASIITSNTYAGAMANSANVFTGTVYTAVNSAFGVINTSFGLTNTTYAAVNSAFGVINASFGVANTALQNTSGVAFNGNLNFPTGNVIIGSVSQAAPNANAALINASFVIAKQGGPAPNFIMVGDGEQTFRFYNSNTAANSSTRVSWKLANRNNTDWNWIMYNDYSGNGSNNLVFQSNPGGVALFINADNNRNVGLSTLNPQYKLDCNGSANISSPTLIVNGSNVLASFDSANNYAGFMANSANVFTGTVYTAVNSVFGVTNAAFGVANAAYGNANNLAISANAYAGFMANSANGYANNTFLKLTAGSQTITGDLAITGNLTFTGNAITISSNTLAVGDSLIYLAANNYTGTDTLPIGIIANYGNTTGANVHTGFVRNPSNKQYYLFNGYDIEPGTNNQINFGANNMTTAVLNADLITSNLTLGGANAIVWITGIVTNTAASFGLTNLTYAAVNSAFGVINAVFTSSNADYVVSNAAFGHSNLTYNAVNSAFGVINAAYTQANTDNVRLSSAFTQANTDNVRLSAAYVVVNSAYTSSNAGYTVANAAFGHSNLTYNAVNSAFGVINSAFTQSNTDNIRLSAAYVSSNSAYVVANAAFNKANNISVNIAAAPPAGAIAGNLWWDTGSGRLFIYYTDVDSSQWVETSPSGAPIDYSIILSNTSGTVFNGALNIGGGANSALWVYDRTTTGAAAFYRQAGITRFYDSQLSGDVFAFTSTGNVGIGTVSPTARLQVNGSFAANTKSFVIDHPSKPGMKLRYGSLEGPENGVYLRGRISGQNFIEYPDYWSSLVHIDSTTVQLTPIGDTAMPRVAGVMEDGILLLSDNKNIDCYYFIQAERKDVEKLVVEF